MHSAAQTPEMFIFNKKKCQMICISSDLVEWQDDQIGQVKSYIGHN